MTQFNRLVLTASPKTSGKSLSTFVDAAPTSNELVERLSNRLVHHGISQHARPLGSRSLVYFLTIGGAQDDRGKWLVGGGQI
jgi:hypothetical protein